LGTAGFAGAWAAQTPAAIAAEQTRIAIQRIRKHSNIQGTRNRPSDEVSAFWKLPGSLLLI
jgi:hypothetical protein